MNSAFLLVPLFLMRYGLLYWLNREALPRAAHFPPMQGVEKTMYGVYQAATLALVVCMFFLRVEGDAPWFAAGMAVYAAGVVLFFLSVLSFAKPGGGGVHQGLLYRFSRNPMYVAYFVYFLGCALLTRSAVLLALLVAFQIAAHWIIRAEERWCTATFGEEYVRYAQRVRRYL